MSEDPSVLDNVDPALPQLERAQELQSHAASIGFDWPDVAGPLAKVREEIAELEGATSAAGERDELGDLLFSVVNLARHLGIPAELALRAANEKFARRFRAVEEMCRGRGVSPAELGLAELDHLWDEAKRIERSQTE